MSQARAARISIVDVTFGLWAAVIPLLFHGRLLNGDGDLARHIVIGRHILEHGPRFEDPFSFSRPGEPFLAYEWLSQVIFAATHGLAGLPGVAVLGGFILAAALALVVLYVRNGGDPWLAFLVGITAAVLTGVHWLARPHLFTFLGLAVLINLLPRRRPALLVLPLFALWANLHPGFLYGLAMLALWGIGSAVEDVRSSVRQPREAVTYRLTPLAAAAAGSLLNPFGWSLHTHAVGLLRSNTVRVVHEFMPMEVLQPYSLIFLGTCAIIVLALAAQKEWVGTEALLVFVGSVFVSLAARRNAPLFALFALPLMARALTPAVRALPARVFGRMRSEFAKGDSRRMLVGPAAAALVLALLTADGRLWPRFILPDDFSATRFPEAAVDAARGEGLQGRLLSSYMWGGYVLYSWPGQRIFVDSMADFFGDELVEEYRKLEAAAGDWSRIMQERKFELVLFPPDTPIVGALRRSGVWRVVHEDSVAVLLQKVDVTPLPST